MGTLIGIAGAVFWIWVIARVIRNSRRALARRRLDDSRPAADIANFAPHMNQESGRGVAPEVNDEEVER